MAKKSKTASVVTNNKLSAPFQVPLSALDLSEDNVRSKESVSQAGIVEMASMLLATGQLTPLAVVRSGDKFSVCAGGRRTRGFWYLRDHGVDGQTISADHLVDVREILDPADARDISLIENISQEAMHPVDQYLAFQHLVEAGKPVDEIAKTYGVTAIQVKRRMKLAKVHPELLQQFRDGKINVVQITALAQCDDQERQLQIWNSLSSYNRNDHTIRARIREDQIPVTDPRVAIVGLQSYLDAGGTVEQDLFDAEGEGQYLTDPGLLEFLLSEKLEVTVLEVKEEGWAWVEQLPQFGWEERQKYPEMPATSLPETQEQKVRREALQAQFDKLSEQREAIWNKDEEDEGDDDASNALSDQMEGIENEILALEESRKDTSGADKSVCGAVVYIDGGSIVVKRALIKKDELKKINAAKANAERAAAANGAGEGSGGEAPAMEDLSERLTRNLTAQKTAAIQALMLQQQNVTMAMLASLTSRRIIAGELWNSTPLKIQFNTTQTAITQASPSYEGSPADDALTAEFDYWKGLLPADTKAHFAWFLEQPLDVSLRMITLGTAMSIDAMRGNPTGADTGAELAQALNLNMSDWWHATRENYLELVPKAKIFEAVNQAYGPSHTSDWNKLKKPEILDRADELMRKSNWLPPILR